MYVRPYKRGSQGFKALMSLLRSEGVRTLKEPYDAKGARVVNWGGSSKIRNAQAVLNNTDSVRNAISKQSTYKILQHQPSITSYVPNFVEIDIPGENGDPDRDYIISDVTDNLFGYMEQFARRDDSAGVMLRKDGMSKGKGIHVMTTEEVNDWLEDTDETEGIDFFNEYDFMTPLYRSSNELRIHVFRDKVLCASVKRSKDDNANPYIRNTENGWYLSKYNNPEENLSAEVMAIAIWAVSTLGLDFGAVDILRHKVRGQNPTYKILEINTAPGMDGSTIDAYAKEIQEWFMGGKSAEKELELLKKKLDNFNVDIAINPLIDEIIDQVKDNIVQTVGQRLTHDIQDTSMRLINNDNVVKATEIINEFAYSKDLQNKVLKKICDKMSTIDLSKQQNKPVVEDSRASFFESITRGMSNTYRATPRPYSSTQDPW